MRNDLARALYLYPIAWAEVFLSYQVEIVERRELYSGAADFHGLEHREGIQCAGAADVHVDGQQFRLGDVGRELARDRITRLPRDDTQLLPQSQPVDLHDGAVDGEIECRSDARLERASPLVDLLERRTAQPVRSDGNAPGLQLVEQLRLPLDGELHTPRNGDRVAEEAQRTRRGDRGIEHADRA